MAQWDLTNKIGVYLDRHLVFPLLEFLSSKEVYDEQDLLLGKFELVKNTRMIDYAIDIHKSIHGSDAEIPDDLVQKRKKVLDELKVYQDQTNDIRKTFSEKAVQNQIETTRDGRMLLEFLMKNYKFNIEMMDSVYIFAKSQYECGNYMSATEYLYLYRLLVPPTDKNYLNALWGKLAAEILMQSWDPALDDFNRLKEFIDSNTLDMNEPFGSQLVTLHQRTWLIHWSLFVFFNHPKGQDLIIDTFLFSQQYLNAIQTMCPHILRYLTAAVITNKQRPAVMKELVKVIQQESYQYRDPITEFVECLYVNFDFDGAQQKLRECEQVLAKDFFLVSCLDSFIENARLVIFETFCCIHQCLSIKMLAEKLNMTPEVAERWIVNLIRNARLDAKIDSQLGHVVMGTKKLSPYQQLIEKTKGISLRSQALHSNVEKKAAINHPERVWTRNFKEVRGICTGYVIAFDKHWNLMMSDVDEVYLKPRKAKTPYLSDANEKDVPEIGPKVPRKKKDPAAPATAAESTETAPSDEQASASASEEQPSKAPAEGGKKKRKRKKKKGSKSDTRNIRQVFIRGDNVVMVAILGDDE